MDAPKLGGRAVYVPTEDERKLLLEALEESSSDPASLQDWAAVRRRLRART